MNKILLLILLGILGCSSGTQKDVYKTYYNNDKLISVQSFKNGALNGISRQYYETGTIKHVINYKNNEISGMYHTYYPDGALWVNEAYDEGHLVGRREYSEEGEIVKNEGYGW